MLPVTLFFFVFKVAGIEPSSSSTTGLPLSSCPWTADVVCQCCLVQCPAVRASSHFIRYAPLFLSLIPSSQLTSAVPKVCCSEDPMGSASSSLGIRGYISVMATLQFTYFSIEGIILISCDRASWQILCEWNQQTLWIPILLVLRLYMFRAAFLPIIRSS